MSRTGSILLRPALLDDVPMLRRWEREPAILAATGNHAGGEDWRWEVEVPRTVAWRELSIAECAGRPIGMLQIIDAAEEETHYWGDVGPGIRAIDIWIGEPDLRGQGHGTGMMRAALERCFADPVCRAVLVDPLASNSRAHRFYERLGFRAAGPRRFGADDCTVYRLERAEWDREPSP
jgi:aminoglycoside 6'-N-acetyltransferase